MSKKRNPNDLTTRNAKAYNKKFKELADENRELKKKVRVLESVIKAIGKACGRL